MWGKERDRHIHTHIEFNSAFGSLLHSLDAKTLNATRVIELACSQLASLLLLLLLLLFEQAMAFKQHNAVPICCQLDGSQDSHIQVGRVAADG